MMSSGIFDPSCQENGMGPSIAIPNSLSMIVKPFLFDEGKNDLVAS